VKVFDYTTTKDGQVFISYHGRNVTALRGVAADRFLDRVQAADRREAQIVMARATGNFKRGNER
jgi:hypothetical protein